MWPSSLPPGPRAPALVQTLRFLRDPYALMTSCARRFGDAFTLRLLGGRSLVIVSGPSAVRDLFTAPAGTLEVGAGRDAFAPFVGAGSLLTTTGAPHAAARREVAPALHGAALRAMGPAIRDATLRAIAAAPRGRRIAAGPLVEAVALETILRAVFGLEDARALEGAGRAVRRYLEAITPAAIAFPLARRDLGAWSPGGALARRRAEADGAIARLASARGRARVRERGRGVFEDVLERLLLARGGDGALRDPLVTMLLTGHETVATALAWALHFIHATPGVRERLVAEVDALGAGDDPAAAEAAPYLEAVCLETLRIRPVVPGVDRRVARACAVGGVALEPGQLVGLSFFLEHHREATFARPAEFLPERHLERRFGPYELMPFGGGDRRCLGERLALLEMKVVLATLLARLDVTLATRGPVRPVRRNITVGPSRVDVVLRERGGASDYTTAAFTQLIGGSESKMQLHDSPPSRPIQSCPVVVPK